MKLKPKELWTWRYWVHLYIISFIFLLILQIWQHGDMLTLQNLAISGSLIGAGDIIAHTLLKID
jgi:hypothetical protein